MECFFWSLVTRQPGSFFFLFHLFDSLEIMLIFFLFLTLECLCQSFIKAVTAVPSLNLLSFIFESFVAG